MRREDHEFNMQTKIRPSGWQPAPAEASGQTFQMQCLGQLSG